MKAIAIIVVSSHFSDLGQRLLNRDRHPTLRPYPCQLRRRGIQNPNLDGHSGAGLAIGGNQDINLLCRGHNPRANASVLDLRRLGSDECLQGPANMLAEWRVHSGRETRRYLKTLMRKIDFSYDAWIWSFTRELSACIASFASTPRRPRRSDCTARSR
jgi:hypothetical protein